MYEIEIGTKAGFKDVRGHQVLSDIISLGINNVKKVEYSSLYLIDAEITFSECNDIAYELLSDKITENFTVKQDERISKQKTQVIEVWYKKGVTDTVAQSVLKAVKDLSIDANMTVKTGRKYYIYGDVDSQTLEQIATKLLANTLIQEYKIK